MAASSRGGWQTIDKAPANAQHLLDKRRIIFDSQLRKVGALDVWRLGDKDDLRAAVAHALHVPKRTEQMVLRERLDGGAPGIPGKVAAMVFETAMDLRASVLWPRLGWNHAAAKTFARTGELTEPLLGPSLGEVQHLRILAGQEGSGMTHGSQVMSRLVVGLDDITVFPISMDSLLSEPALLAGGLLQLLQPTMDRHRVRVVNISQAYIHDGFDCEALFGPLMRHYEEKVLFVAGAPNTGKSHQNFCPMQLKDSHPNLLIVGGIDHPRRESGRERAEDGSEASASTFGAEGSTVLTQMYQQVLDFADGSEKTRTDKAEFF